MATTFRFQDHGEFHRAAIHMTLAGGLAGLAAHVAGLVVRAGGYPFLAPWSIGAIAAGAAYGAMHPDRRARIGEILRIVVLCAAAAAAWGWLARPGRDGTLGLAGLGLGFGLALARGLGGRRRAVTVLVGAAATLAALYVAGTFATAPEIGAVLPTWLIAGLGGAAFGFVGVLGVLPRHIDVGHDRVADAYAACRETLTGEVRELADRARAVWTLVDGTLEQESPVRRAIEDSVVRLYDVARKWQSVEAEGARTSADALVARMEQIDRKIAATEDSVARGQYEHARAALAEQLRYLKEIATSRERVVARMHHYLAAMERLRFAVINHRSADASRLSTEVQPILDDLKDLGKEIDVTNEAMGEVERENEAAAPEATPN